MTLQIAKIILYNDDGRTREIPFSTGKLNIITGASNTGKTCLIDIVDYCMASRDCNIAEGVSRYVSWFSVLFQKEDEQIFVARCKSTKSSVYFDRAKKITPPPLSKLTQNSTVPSLKSFLSGIVGIGESKDLPLPEENHDTLKASIRHAVAFCFQKQTEIGSNEFLFRKTDDKYIAEGMKRTFPYFLGAINEDHLQKKLHLDNIKKDLRRLKKQLRATPPDARIDDYSDTFKLFNDVKKVGLVNTSEEVKTVGQLENLFSKIIRENIPPHDLVSETTEVILHFLRSDRSILYRELDEVKVALEDTLSFQKGSSGFQTEAREQKDRLISIGLFKEENVNNEVCPLCSSSLTTKIPAVSEVNNSLKKISSDLETVEREDPEIQKEIETLRYEKDAITDKIRSTGRLINHYINEDNKSKEQYDIYIQHAEVIGKIKQYLATSSYADDGKLIASQIKEKHDEINILSEETNQEDEEERLNSCLNILNTHIMKNAERLKLEYHDTPLHLDIKNMTLISDTENGPVPFITMGGGENWVGYHVLIHLVLHQWFRRKSRPVPAFLILDQPSQAQFPNEHAYKDKDKDKEAVKKLFSLIHSISEELSPSMQIILLDHADFEDEWFQDAIIEKWRGGHGLIPQDWMTK